MLLARMKRRNIGTNELGRRIGSSCGSMSRIVHGTVPGAKLRIAIFGLLKIPFDAWDKPVRTFAHPPVTPHGKFKAKAGGEQ